MTMEKMQSSKVDTIGNGIALLLGLAFLGDVLGLWNFDPFDGWWVLFLYIPAVCGFITRGVTAGGILLTLTAVVLTIGMFTEIDGRIWGIALLPYLAYLGGKALYCKWNAPNEAYVDGEAQEHHAV